MLYVAVTNDLDGQLCSQIYKVLSKTVSVVQTVAGGVFADSHNADIILCSCQDLQQFHVPNPIIIVGGGGRESSVYVPYCAVVIADVGFAGGIYGGDGAEIDIIDCGLSPKATCTFSSMGQENLVVSLQRPITDVYGQVVEPVEVPIDESYGTEFTALAACCLLFLGGFENG